MSRKHRQKQQGQPPAPAPALAPTPAPAAPAPSAAFARAHLLVAALGLAVAIPAVLGYNALVRGNKHILIRLNSFAHDLHAYFVTGARVTSSGDNGNVRPLKKGN